MINVPSLRRIREYDMCTSMCMYDGYVHVCNVYTCMSACMCDVSVCPCTYIHDCVCVMCMYVYMHECVMYVMSIIYMSMCVCVCVGQR